MTYTPTTDEVEHRYAYDELYSMDCEADHHAFRRWLAAHDAQVAAQALREAADKIHVSLQQANKRAGRTLDPMFSQHDQGLWDGYKNAENWLRARANRIEQGGQP